MAKRIFQTSNWTPSATADGATLANATYMALKGGSATQLNRISEVYAGGMAAASAPTPLSLARSSTIALTPTALAAPASDGPAKASTAALAAVPVTFTAASTGGQRSAATTDPKLHLGFNAFGALVRWQAPPDGEFEVLGNTAALFGEVYLSSQNFGTPGLIVAHVIYEPM